MHAFIGETLLASTETHPRSKPFEIYDNRLRGFTLRVQPSGHRSYYVRFGRNRRIALGDVESLTPLEARERCRKVIGNVVHGNHPLHGIQGSEGMTLGMFIADAYTAWINASRPRTSANTLEKLHRHFRTWYSEPLTSITVERIESWKARRLSEGRSPSTVLRDLFTLSSVLRHAVKAGELTDNPVRRIDKPRIERRGQVRFLDEVEESQLRTALLKRDERMKRDREANNAQRLKLGEPLLAPLLRFGDHLTPAVLLTMNTGLRRGELLKLRWAGVSRFHAPARDHRRSHCQEPADSTRAAQRRSNHRPAPLARSGRRQRTSVRICHGFQDCVDKASQARGDHAISLARLAASLRLAPGAARRPAQHSSRFARTQHRADVAALCALGARSTARGRGQAQRKADSRAYPALTVELVSGRRL
jgi:Arm DNA-binding domain